MASSVTVLRRVTLNPSQKIYQTCISQQSYHWAHYTLYNETEVRIVSFPFYTSEENRHGEQLDRIK